VHGPNRKVIYPKILSLSKKADEIQSRDKGPSFSIKRKRPGLTGAVFKGGTVETGQIKGVSARNH